VILLDGPARARLVDRFGPGVTRWCDELPAAVERLTRNWGLDVLSAIAGGTGSTFLCRGCDGHTVVLKLTPELDIAATEATALRAWAGCSRVVHLIDTDFDAGAVLLAGVVPGTPLAESPDPAPMDQIAELLGQLHSATPVDGLPRVSERVSGLFQLAERRWRGSAAEGHLPLEVLHRSRAAAAELAGGGCTTLVHGDLHPGNVLQGAAGIVAIDPRPCVGDPTFDAVDWALWPVSRGGRLEDGIAALGAYLPSLDTSRLREWCRALAVLLALGPLRRQGPNAYTESLLRMAP
jgi:streptomycin 6-kinase